MSLTSRQTLVLRVVAAGIDENGYPPTFREVSRAIGNSSTHGTAEVVGRLVHRGCLTRAPKTDPTHGHSRTLVLTDRGREYYGGSIGCAESLDGPGMFRTPSRCTICDTCHFTDRCPVCER